MKAIYDKIGRNYTDLRRPDLRIASAIDGALGCAQTVLNVGAGSGAYEPVGRQVIALEPSVEMIRQRSEGSAPVCRGIAEKLPFANVQFDASMAILTIHHWTNAEVGLQEMRRVTRQRIVIVTFDPSSYFWLLDYIPELADMDRSVMPSFDMIGQVLGANIKISSLPVPYDCTDGFLGAYWRRPEAYLDAQVRAATSPFSKIACVSEPLNRLRRDLETGAWAQKYGNLLSMENLDVGYRLVVAELR